MSLATRCTSCQTVFRVVQDQLKVSEGWVRCGRCGTVFNALEVLFDLDREREPPTPPKKTVEASASTAKQTREARRTKPKRENSREKVAEASPTTRRRSDHTQPGEPATKPNGFNDFADAQFAPDADTEADHAAARRRPETSTYDHDETTIAGTESPDQDVDEDYEPATLEFVRVADRKAKWADPRVRLMAGVGTLVLSLVLLLQVGHHFRDITAAKWPEAAPLLVRWCQLLDCQLQAPRDIESVVVESITMTRNANSTDTFLLSVALQNRSSFAVAVPALDLTLRDANGALITRRMLKPEELQLKTRAIEANSETQVQVTLTEKEQRIVGYTVEAFYP